MTVFERPTVRALVDWMRDQPAVAVSDLPASLIVVKEGGPARPIFLIAGGRGGRSELSLYGRLMARLPPDRLVYGLLRPPCGDTVEEIARECIATIRRVRPHGPYELGGECVGGVVAYEIAQQLAGAGERVELMFLLDTWCPTTTGVMHHRFLGQPLALAKLGIAFLRDLPARTSVEPWWAELRRRATVSPDEQRYIRACMAYRPRPYAGNVTLLASEHSAKHGIARAWQAAVAGNLRVVTTPGDHESYARRHAAEAAEQVRLCIEGSA